MRDVLAGEARETALAPLKATGWAETPDGKGLAKSFRFKDFTRAFGWMASVATVAEKLDHHPEWRNVYKTVDVVLTTHTSGGVSMLDVALAAKMDSLAS